LKKIIDYRKLFGVTETAGLQELKTIYRGLMKSWHPDKFNDSEESKLEAEEKSKSIIEAYHFLVSIAPETKEKTSAEYALTTASAIMDFVYKGQILTITFMDGNEYEYYGVPKNVYVKLINADSPGRFFRRHISESYLYRSTSRLAATA